MDPRLRTVRYKLQGEHGSREVLQTYRVRAETEGDTYLEFLGWTLLNHLHTLDFNFLCCKIQKLEKVFSKYLVACNPKFLSQNLDLGEARGPQAAPPISLVAAKVVNHRRPFHSGAWSLRPQDRIYVTSGSPSRELTASASWWAGLELQRACALPVAPCSHLPPGGPPRA